GGVSHSPWYKKGRSRQNDTAESTFARCGPDAVRRLPVGAKWRRSILVDGGHPGDRQARNGFPAIPDQLQELLGHSAPFPVNLLVVSHSHSDHIGCLPTWSSPNVAG